MIPYTVMGSDNNRVLMVANNAMQRFKFKQVIDSKITPVKFKRVGSNCVAVVSDTVMVYKKPHASKLHYEFMRNNRLGLAGWGKVDHDTLIETLLEYEKSI